MLTLFDTERYYRDAASSTILVAMSTGTPLIVEPGFLDVYTFVNNGAVVVADNGDYASAIDKVLHMNEQEWGDLAMEVGPRCAIGCIVPNACKQKDCNCKAMAARWL